MSIAGARNRPSDKILALFNKLIEPKPVIRVLDLKALSVIYGALDDRYSFNEAVRIELQDELDSLKDGEIDPNQVLTDGPFKGSTIAWVCAYIASSNCTFPQAKTNMKGYSYFLTRIITLSGITKLDFTASFKPLNLNLSALWLTVYSDVRNAKIAKFWFTRGILQQFSGKQLRRLNVNALGVGDNNIAISVLAQWIKADYKIDDSGDLIHFLLNKVSPIEYPEFYNFNQFVLDKANNGMTTLCFAAQLEASNVKKDIPVSEASPLISILKKASITRLDLNARIRDGVNQGKTPLWYAAYIATGQIYESLDEIIEKADLDQLDFNAKAEDASDDDANSSVLWLTSFLLVNNRHGYPILTILRKRKDISTLDFNNCPISNIDGDKGKTVLWQCALAALEGKQGDDEALLIILNNSQKLSLDYTAKAESGPYANQAVSDLILQLAQEGNVLPLVKMLMDNNRPHEIEQKIPPTIWAIMSSKLKQISLEDEQFDDLEMIQEGMLRHQFSVEDLRAVVPSGTFKGQTTLRLLIDLALAGFPLLLKHALTSVDIAHILNTEPKSETRLSLLELKRQCAVALMEQHGDNITILSEFLSGRGHGVQDYVEMSENVDALLKQFSAFKIKPDDASLQQVFDEKLKFTPAKWG